MPTEYQKHLSFGTISGQLWKELLKNKSANIFHQPDAVLFFESSGVETFTLALENDGVLKALVTGIIQKEPGKIKSIFTRRAIIFGGPVFSEEITSKEISILLRELIELLKNNAIYIEIRNFKDYSDWTDTFKDLKFEYIPHLNFHVDCEDEDKIRKGMSKSKLRQVKKSIKEGAEIVEGKTESQIKEFYSILKDLYDTKIRTPLFPESFFIKFLNQGIGKYFLVKYENRIIGGIMCPILDNRVIYEWFVCGEDGRYKGVYPSILATWAAIDYANKNGIERFDFMGAGSPDKDYGVREFKSKFGGELVEHGRFLYIAKPFLYWLGKSGLKMLKRKR